MRPFLSFAWRHKLDVLNVILLGIFSIALIWPICPPYLWTTQIQYGDASILAYILSWGAHAILNQPFSYYNIPLGYPQTQVLAGMDGMLFQAVLITPLWAFTKCIPLVYNVSVLLSFWFCLASGYVSALLLLKSRWIAFAVATVFTVTIDRYSHANGHVNLIYTGFIPLVFAFTFAGLSNDKPVWYYLGATSLGLSVYASNYLFVLSALTFIIAAFCYAAIYGFRFHRKQIKTLTIVGGLGILIALPIPLIHWSASRHIDSQRGDLATANTNAATVSGWLKPANYPDFVKSRDAELMGLPDQAIQNGEDVQFIGFLVTFCIILQSLRLMGRGGYNRWTTLDKKSFWFLVVAGLLVLSSFGPYIQVFGHQIPGPYLLLNRLFLQFTGFFRIPPRLAFITSWLFALVVGILIATTPFRNCFRLAAACCMVALITWYEHASVTSVPKYSFTGTEIMDKLDQFNPDGSEAVVIVPDPRMLGNLGLATSKNWRPLANAWPDNPLLVDYSWFFRNLDNLQTTRTATILAKRGIDWVITTTPDAREHANASVHLEPVYSLAHHALFKLKNPRQLVQVAGDLDKLKITERNAKRANQPEPPTLILDSNSGTLKPVSGYQTQVTADAAGLILAPEHPGFMSAYISVPSNFDNHLYDQVEITYSLGTESPHHVGLYFSTSEIPMSQRTYITGHPQKKGKDYTVTFSLHKHPDWLYIEKFHGFRFDISNVLKKKVKTARISKVTFSHTPTSH